MTNRRAVIAQDHHRLDEAARALLHVVGLLPQQEARAKLMRPDLGAQDLDAGGGHEHWCHFHQQDAKVCNRKGLESPQRVLIRVDDSNAEWLLDAAGEPIIEDQPCKGVLIARASDRTGDAVVANEKFLEKVRAFDTSEAIVIEHVGRLRSLQKWFLRTDPTDDALDVLAQANQVACDAHLRYGFVRQARSKKGTRVRIGRTDRFVFEVPHRLCDFCETVAQEDRRLPTEREVRDNVAGKRRKKEERNPSPRRAHV